MLPDHYLEIHQRNAAQLSEHTRNVNAAVTQRRARRLDRKAAAMARVAELLGAAATHYHRKARALV